MDKIRKRFFFRAYFRAFAAFLVILAGYLGLTFYFIKNQASQTEEMRKNEIMRLVNTAYNLVSGHIDDYRNNLTDRNTALERVTGIVREMTYEDSFGKNYLFMSSFDGTMLVQPFEPEKEGTSQWDMVDRNGIYIIRELVKAATSESGEGFVTYHYYNPQFGRPMEKMSYVIGIKELGCYLGVGLYMDDIRARWLSYIYNSILLIALLFAAIFLFVTGIIRPVLKTSEILMMYFNRLTDYPDELFPVSPGLMGKNIYTRFMLESFNKMITRISDYSKKLAGSEQKFRSFFANSADAIIFTSEKLEILDANSSAMDVFGYKGSEMFGMGFSSLFTGEKSLDMIVSSLKVSGYLRNREEKMLNKNRQLIDAVITAMISPERKGAEKLYYFIIRDVTDSRKLERQLVQSQKLETIGSLAGGIAHDFNNYLGAITGTISLLKYDYETEKDIRPERFSKYMKILEDSCDNAARMITQLQSVSGRYTEKLSVRNLGAVCSHVADICRNTIDKSVEISYETPEKDVFVYADSRIEQVILNMCINASHSMTIMRESPSPWGGTLAISVFTENPENRGEYAVVSVKDTGVGIKQENLDKIFDPFFTTKGRGQGSGLGLAVAYRTALQHNGFITAESVPGEGSVFRLYLPAAAGESRDGIPEGAVFKPLSGKVLIIDDEKVFRETLVEMIRMTGFECEAVSSASEGIAVLGNSGNSFSLVILDVAMPGMSGTEAYPLLKKINPEMKILLTSGYGSDPRIESLLRDGVDGFIQKPYTLEKLYKKISSLF